jgi:acetyl esterase/lipase
LRDGLDGGQCTPARWRCRAHFSAGSSAGGNLAINAAYLANAGRLESSCGGTVPRVSAVSVLYPPVDLAAAWVSQVPAISDMARQFNINMVSATSSISV